MKKTKVKKPRRLLCYIDFSDHSYYIVEYAFELAKLVDAELFVLHSVTDIKRPPASMFPTSIPIFSRIRWPRPHGTRCMPSATRW